VLVLDKLAVVGVQREMVDLGIGMMESMERLRSSNDLVHGLTLASPHTQSDEARGATRGRDKAARRLLVESSRSVE
jgi:hypothetical protein